MNQKLNTFKDPLHMQLIQPRFDFLSKFLAYFLLSPSPYAIGLIAIATDTVHGRWY